MIISKKSIFSKTLLLIVFVSIISGGLVLVVAIEMQSRLMENSLIEENKVLARLIAKSIESAWLDFYWPIEMLREISELEDILFWWVIKPNGEIYQASDPEMWGKIVNEPSVDTKELIIKDSIFSETGEKMKLIIHPLSVPIGTFYLGVSLNSITVARTRMILNGLGSFFAIIVLATFIAFYFSKSLSKPLERLQEGTAIIAKGDLDYRINLKTDDEIEELAESFNQMTKSLKESREALEMSKASLEIRVEAKTKALKDLTQGLDREVKERTKELQKKINELEKFQKITVGRELRMAELKKKIRELQLHIKKQV